MSARTVLGLAALLTSSGVPHARGGEDCRLNGIDETVRCYSVEVRETPGRGPSRTLRIRVVVLPAIGAGSVREPLLILQGGPGVASTHMARSFSQRRLLREGRDLVFVDQRGTTGSGALSCGFLGRHNFLGALFPRDHVSRCRQELARRADLATYTNAMSAQDLEAVRKTIGADRWSVLGYSFGTRLAQEYARRYPAPVRAVVLDGVVPFDAFLTAELAQSMERSLQWVLARCEHDTVCVKRYPGTRTALGRLAQRLESRPVAINVSDASGRTLAGPFGAWEFAYAIRGMLYSSLAASLPAMALHADRTGDFSAFAQVYWDRTRWVGDSTSLALHLGVYCSEDLPFVDSVDAVRRAAGTLIGPRYFREYRAGCVAWPMPRVAEELRRPWKSAIPTLLLSGERDPVTPPAYGVSVARNLSRSRHVVFRGGGHAENSWCKLQLIVAFLEAPGERRLDVSCADLDWFPGFREE